MKKAALKLLFLSTSVMAMMFLERFLAELFPAEITLPELCPLEFRSSHCHESRVFAQLYHLTASFATHELLLHLDRFLSPVDSPYLTCTCVHYQHGAYRQYQPSFCFHSFALHFNGLNTLFLS